MARLLPIAVCAVLLLAGCQISDHQGWCDQWFGSSDDCSSGGCADYGNDCSEQGSRCAPDRLTAHAFFYCSTIDDCFAKHAANRCATKALRSLAKYTQQSYSYDFTKGFRQAYVDIAMGGSGATPVVPPQKYWNAYYRAPKGRIRACEWFGGYQSGAESAYADRLNEINKITSAAACQSGRWGVQSHEFDPRVQPTWYGYALPQQNISNPVPDAHHAAPTRSESGR